MNRINSPISIPSIWNEIRTLLFTMIFNSSNKLANSHVFYNERVEGTGVFISNLLVLWMNCDSKLLKKSKMKLLLAIQNEINSLLKSIWFWSYLLLVRGEGLHPNSSCHAWFESIVPSRLGAVAAAVAVAWASILSLDRMESNIGHQCNVLHDSNTMPQAAYISGTHHLIWACKPLYVVWPFSFWYIYDCIVVLGNDKHVSMSSNTVQSIGVVNRLATNHSIQLRWKIYKYGIASCKFVKIKFTCCCWDWSDCCPVFCVKLL